MNNENIKEFLKQQLSDEFEIISTETKEKDLLITIMTESGEQTVLIENGNSNESNNKRLQYTSFSKN